MTAEHSASDPTPERDALSPLIREMRMIAIVAGQWSVENADDEAHSMAAEEARRASRWADQLAQLSTDIASLAARWREKAEALKRSHVANAIISAAILDCADDLAALRGMTKEDLVTRSGELAVDPAPQHAPTDPKG